MDSIESAHEAFRASDLDRASDICSRLIQADSANDEAWHLLAWCEFQRGNVSRAVQGAAEATRYNDKAWKYFHDLGFFLRRGHADERAVGAFAKAVELEPSAVPAWTQMGGALTVLGKFEDAIAAHRKAAEIDHLSAAQSLLALVELDNYGARAGEREKLEKAHRSIQVGRDRALLGFALGQVHERNKEYAPAFEYYAKANEDRRRNGHLNVSKRVAGANAYLAEFGPDVIDATQSSELESDKPIFIVGMPRSGTTLLEQLLARHPDVHAGGESGEFARLIGGVVRQLSEGTPILEGLGQAGLKATADSYLNYLSTRFPDAQRVTEKLPLNFTLVGMIAKLFPRAKIIYTTRHYLDTCWSCWTTSFANPSLAFTQQELGAFHALYEHTMAHWRSVVPASLCEVSYEELVRNTEDVMRRVTADLSLAWTDALVDEGALGQTPIRTASVVQARRPISRSSIDRARPFRDRLSELTASRDATLTELSAA